MHGLPQPQHPLNSESSSSALSAAVLALTLTSTTNLVPFRYDLPRKVRRSGLCRVFMYRASHVAIRLSSDCQQFAMCR